MPDVTPPTAPPAAPPSGLAALNNRVAGAGAASTIWGIVIGTLGDAVVQIVNALASSAAIDPKLGHIFALIAVIVGALWPAVKKSLPADAPKGYVVRPWLLALLALVVVFYFAGCATLKGASTSTTVTLKDGQSYTLTATDAGGCVATAAGTWIKIPKTPLECDHVCVDVNPGAVTPGAKCRVCDPNNPAVCVPVDFAFPVPISSQPKTS